MFDDTCDVMWWRNRTIYSVGAADESKEMITLQNDTVMFFDQ